MNELILNPLIRIISNPNQTDGFVLENLELKKTFELSPDLVKLVNFCVQKKTPEEIVTFVSESFEEPVETSEVKALVSIFKKNKILVSEAEYQKIIAKNSDWFKYDWHIPLHLMLATENIEVLDKSGEVRPKIMKEYLAKDKVPEFYKSYPKNKQIKLPPPQEISPESLAELLGRRRTSRAFSGEITPQELSTLLTYSCHELKDLRDTQQKNFKTHPEVLLQSLFTPFEIYLIVNRVTGIPAGAYHYNLKTHSLELIKEGTLARDVGIMTQGQAFYGEASVVLLISAVFERYMFRYRQARAYRELLGSASQLAHFFVLYATALHIKSAMTPALKDSYLVDLLQLPVWEEEALYLLSLGK